MLDLKFIRENPDLVRQAIINRQDKSSPLDEILQLDAERRRMMTELDELRRNRKTASKERQADAAEAGRALRNKIKELEDETNKLDARLTDLLLQMPNIPNSKVPVGKDSNDNVVVRTWGEPKQLPFNPKPHWELGENLGIIDFERGVKLSGTRFTFCAASVRVCSAPSSLICWTYTRWNTAIKRYILPIW